MQATEALAVPAKIAHVEHLATDVLRVVVRPTRAFPHRGGQWVTLLRDDGLARPYSIASVPRGDDTGDDPVELHVRVIPNGRMSGWLAGSDAVGAEVQLRGPAGDCFYTAGNLAQGLLLAGTGTGLAPLWSVARQALRAGHAGPIELWHGARDAEGLYLADEIRALAGHHARLEYRPCVLEGPTSGDLVRGRLDELLLQGGGFAGRRLFLCGDPSFVATMKRSAFLGGAALRDIHADAFVTAPGARSGDGDLTDAGGEVGRKGRTAENPLEVGTADASADGWPVAERRPTHDASSAARRSCASV